MRIKYLILFITFIVFGACSSTKKAFSSEGKNIVKIKNILDFALDHEGVRYRYGGTTRKGMDCSGLIITSYDKANIVLPRRSRDMAKAGKKIPLVEVKKGDLVFFAARNRRKLVDHVGLVVEVTEDDIKFIHATTQRGVIISSFQEYNWKRDFVKAVTFF